MILFKRHLQQLFRPLVLQREPVNLMIELAPQHRQFGWLAQLVNGMIGRFRAGVSHIAGQALRLSAAAPEMALLAEQMDRQAQDNQHNADSIAGVSRNMAEELARIAGHAAEAASFSQTVADDTRRATDSNRVLTRQIVTIGQQVQVLADVIEDLDRRAHSIGSLIGQIDSVAGQARTLAGAAISQAERGHDPERKAAASEVCQLATRATEATGDIARLLAAIGQGIGAAKHSMDTVGREIGHSLTATANASDTLERAAGHIDRLVHYVGAIADGSQAQATRVAQVNAQIQEIASASHAQRQGCDRLAGLGREVRGGCEDLLVAVGGFQFEGHQRALTMVETLIGSWRLTALEPAGIDALLAGAARRYPAFELLYVTDARGVQLSANVAATGRDERARGRRWGGRPWYRDVVTGNCACVSAVYRSLATDNFCFTVSAPLTAPDGHLLGVLGVDVHFDRMLDLGEQPLRMASGCA